MNGAGGRFLAVGSTNVVVLRGLVVCVPIAALVIHFRAALAAVEQPRQRVRLQENFPFYFSTDRNLPFVEYAGEKIFSAGAGFSSGDFQNLAQR